MTVNSLYIEDIGEVDFHRNKRSKSLRITVKSSGRVRISYPYRCSFAEAKGFIIQKKEIIRDTLKKVNSKRVIYDENTDFRTRKYRFSISKHNKETYKLAVCQDIANIFYPETVDIHAMQTQNELKKVIIKVMRTEAKEYLPQRVRELAQRYSFKYKNVSVKNLKSRWGSCSAIDNINLNLHLMRLPQHLQDYVILHELAHTKQKNHSINFRQLLDSIVIDSKSLDRELRVYSTEL